MNTSVEIRKEINSHCELYANSVKNRDVCSMVFAVTSIEALIANVFLEARIEELGKVLQDYANQQAQVWVDGETVSIRKRLDELKAKLKASKELGAE